MKTIAVLLGLLALCQGRDFYDMRREVGQGCRGANKCCQGQDIGCWALGPRTNNASSTTCFCDELCLIIGDCCHDYKYNCPEIDCVLSDRWSEWGECDSRCGRGIQTRSREVLVEPKNGGKQCGTMVERRQCEGTYCKVARASEATTEELKETGEIVPATYASWRTNQLYDPFEDIRQNLFREQDKYADLRRDRETPSYCAKYRITEARRSCQSSIDPRHQSKNDVWIKKLVRGSTVCVECQHSAMHKSLGNRCYGHGVNQRETQWKAVTLPRCHGRWVMTSRHIEKCQCDPNRDVSFVFV